MDGNLRAREIEILRLVAQGLSNHEIAKQLDLAPKTIEHMLGTSDPHRALYPKIGVTNRAEAAAWFTATLGTRAPEATPHPTLDTALDHLHNQLIEVYADYQGRLAQLRLNGQPQLAISMADFLVQKTSETARQAHSATYRQRFLQIATQALIEQCTATLEIAPRQQIVAQVRPLVTMLKRFGKEIGEEKSIAMANVVLAGAYNIQKRYEKGRAYYREAYGQTKDVDMKLRILRGITIASTYLHDAEGVREILPLAKHLIEEGNFARLEQVGETCEGLGRGQGLLGSSEAFTWFDTSERILHTLNHPPLRTIQLLTSKQEVTMHLEPTALSAIEKLGQQAIALADRHGYARHQETVMENLRKSLDG